MAGRRVLSALDDGWDWLTDARYERTSIRLAVWAPRSMVALCWAVVAIGLGCALIATTEGSTALMAVLVLGSVAAALFAWRSTLPLAVADDRGVSCWRGVRRRVIPWRDIDGLALTDSWGPGTVLRIECSTHRPTWIFTGMLALSTDTRARAARHLARQVSVFSESIGNGPVRWPQQFRYFDVEGDQVDI